ncbi:phage head closure protein [Pontibaca sp. S1109L]|uniref:Phage head closure protein n=1 Tax=Pontibaca salina TaxID=2795731 RepID=A0A934HTY0_9RHOB|nr:phage head closure protein [Pontibaca salina]MBI6630710.1 phage head closure protein [Pontibaca salina]
MNAGKLDRRVQFRRAVLVDDGYGSVQEWHDHGDPIPAAKRDVSDAEKWQAAEVSASITTRFTVRWNSFTSDLDPKDRLICEGRDYNIVGIKETPERRRRMLELTCVARADQ